MDQVNQTHNHVFVVDDEPNNLRVLHELLSKNGYLVHSIRDSRQVEKVLQNITPDLFLLDINMPHRDGFTLAQMLKNGQATQDIPIIFISANDTEDHIRQGFEVGAVDYITKPIKASEVLARVATHLQLKRQQQVLEEKIAEIETLRQQEQDQYTKLRDMRNQFLQVATHDLKNPLYNIMGYMNLIDDFGGELSPEQLTTFREHIELSTNKMSGLIADILDLLHAESKQIQIDLRPVDLTHYLETELSRFQIRANEKNIEINLCHPPEQVYGVIDPQLFSRIIDNIVSNAIKYSPEKTMITARYNNIQHGVVIEIEDEGYGMSQEVLKNLFTPFYRAPDATKSDIEGTGLGMAITKEIVERHGGVIDVASDIDKGTVFRIVVPHHDMHDLV